MNIYLKTVLMFVSGFAVLAALFFIPAGTTDFWQAWLYMAVLLVPMVLVAAYFLANDPGFLERRFKMREKEKVQRGIQKLGVPLFLAGFILPGLDNRYGWSNVPFEWVIAADALVLLSYMAIFWVFKTNSWAGRTIRVEKGQKVISDGPYGVIRHPMYVAVAVMFLATPFALGSYIALVPFALYLPLLVVRILNEEEVLKRELSGYTEYCKKVKYRLVPGVW